MWVGLFAAAILFQVAHFARAQKTDWDPGLPKDVFSTGSPPERLRAAKCKECNDKMAALQAALDDWYAMRLAEIDKSLNDSNKPPKKTQESLEQEKGDLLKGLGTPKDAGAEAKDKQKKNSDKDFEEFKKKTGKGKRAKDILKDKIASALKELQDCEAKCPVANTETPTPTPASQPGDDGKQTGTAKPDHVIKIDFIINRGATLDEDGAGGKTQEQEDKEIDGYLDKLNKTFSGAGIGFKRNSTTHVNDPNRPEYPETGGEENKASEEQKKVAKEAEDEAKKLKNKGDITVKIVHNFHDKDKPQGSPSSIQGIAIGRTIIVVDPWDVKRNTLGGETWDHTLAHELGHRLGLDHTILPSDKEYKYQEKGVYKEPNAMSPGHGKTADPDEFTPDQIAEMKTRYGKEFAMVIPRQPTGGEYVCFSGNEMTVAIIGTGETIGHVADVRIDNLSDQPINCSLPAMVLESGSGKNQDYVVPHDQDVALRPHESKTVPIDGICVNRHKPPVGKGIGGDLVMHDPSGNIPQDSHSHLKNNDADKLLKICTAKYDTVDKLQKDGAFKDLPYRDKEKQREIALQWSTWSDPRISEIEGGHPATKDDLKKVVEKQVGKVPPDEKKKIDKGIDTIWDKIELTNDKAKDLEKSEGQTPKGSTMEEGSRKNKWSNYYENTFHHPDVNRSRRCRSSC